MKTKKYVCCHFRTYTNKEDRNYERLILNLPWESERSRKALEYARNILQGRWKRAEKYIIKSPYYAYSYARLVMGERWPEAEKVIARETNAAYLYAKYVIGDRFELAEKNTKWHKHPRDFYLYCKYVLKNRWVEIEKKIEKSEKQSYFDAESIVNYVRFVSKSRWEKMENYILQSRHIADYAKVLKKNSSKDYEEFYNKVIVESMKDESHFRYHYNYAKEYIKSLK